MQRRPRSLAESPSSKNPVLQGKRLGVGFGEVQFVNLRATRLDLACGDLDLVDIPLRLIKVTAEAVDPVGESANV